MSKLRRIGINMLSGGMGYLVPMIVNLITTPFVLQSLGEEAYGVQVIANVIIGYLIVADMGLDIPITQKLASYHSLNLRSEQSLFLGATLKIYFLIGFFGATILLIIAGWLTGWLAIPASVSNEAKAVFYLSSVGFLGSILGMWGKAVFNGFQRYDIANGVNITCNVLAIGLGIVLIKMGYGIVGFFSARVLGFLCSSVIYIVLASKYILNFHFAPLLHKETWHQLKNQLGYGFMLRMSGLLFSRMDQTLIGVWTSLSVVTVYSFPILIVTTLSGLIASVTHFVFPMVSSMRATNSQNVMSSLFIKVTKFIVFFTTLVFLPFIVLGDKVLALWINQSIAMESKEVLIILTISFFISTSLNAGVNAFLAGFGYLKFVAYYNLVKGIFLFIGFLLLIKPYGMEGAGFVYLASILIDLFYVGFAAIKKIHVTLAELFLKAYFKPVLIGGVFGSILFLAKDLINTWSDIIVATFVFSFCYATAGFILGVPDEDEKKLIWAFLKKPQQYFPK
jgi:O-antigen/teichoic acid export membrane protein